MTQDTQTACCGPTRCSSEKPSATPDLALSLRRYDLGPLINLTR